MLNRTVAGLILTAIAVLLLVAAGCDETTSSSSRSSSRSEQPSRVVSRPGSNPMSSGSNSGSFRDGSSTGTYRDGGSGTSKTVSVSSRATSWQSTGVYVNAGDSVSISASGSVIHWRSGDGSSSRSCGPGGISGATNESAYLAPGLRKMSLVGKVSGHAFNVGTGTSIKLQK